MKYADFRPTGCDLRGLGLPDRQEWYVMPFSQTRDSDALDRSNFRVARRELDRAGVIYEVHRFGHWGPGWFELILVHPDHAERRRVQELHVDDYPVLDDSDFSELESEEACLSWRNTGIEERIELLRWAAWPKELSVRDLMQARRDAFPRDDRGVIQERLLRP